MPSSRVPPLLPVLGDAFSGAMGTAVSTVATYPLDLVKTRLKVQRHLRRDGTLPAEEEYAGFFDAFRAIHAREGGLAAFFAGLASDVGKSVADSFLFFLFNSWLRAQVAGRKLGAHDRIGSSSSRGGDLRPWEELVVGAAAGAFARAFTTPISNVVTRKQTAALVDSGASAGEHGVPAPLSTRQIIDEIRAEKGLLGLWAGYSATLVLTLNPSITFFLDETLTKSLVPRESWDDPGTSRTFLSAAFSKVVATAVTYPFQIAKARVQVATHQESERDEESTAEVKGKGIADESKEDQEENPRPAELQDGKHKVKGAINAPAATIKSGISHLARDSIFSTVARIAKTEGLSALYDGIGGELLKAFFNHGITMVSKDLIHKLVIRLYFLVLAALRALPSKRRAIESRTRDASDRFQHRLSHATSQGTNWSSKLGQVTQRRVRDRKPTDSDNHSVFNLLEGTRRDFEK